MTVGAAAVLLLVSTGCSHDWDRFEGPDDGGALPTDGLLLHLAFEETDGPTTTDGVSGAALGTLRGAARIADGAHGRALSFDGVDDDVDVTFPTTPDLVTEYTVAAFVRAPGTRGSLVTCHFQPSFQVRFSSIEAKFEALAYGSATPDWPQYTLDGPLPSFDAAAWHHVALVVEGPTATLYFDGELLSEETFAGTLANPGPDPACTLGDTGYGGQHDYLPGALDEIRLYERSLSPEEVASLADL